MISVDELKEIIHLNKLEALLLTKEYFLMYLVSLIKDYRGKEKRKTLIDKLMEYYLTVKEENAYLRFLVDNINSINNEEALNRILDNLDLLNEQTYIYYDSILKEYEDNICCDSLDRKIVPYRRFKVLTSRNDYLEELLGLTLTVSDLKDYYCSFKCFEKLFNDAKVIDVPFEVGKDFYGCYLKEDEATEILMEVNVCVPKIIDLESMCVNVSLFKQGLEVSTFIGEVVPELDYEQIGKTEEKKFKEEYLKVEKIKKR